MEARSLALGAKSAMLRTAIWENAPEGGIPWANMQHEHQTRLNNTIHLTRSAKQADWHRNHMATTVHKHTQEMRKQHGIDRTSIRQDLTKAAPLPLNREDHLRWKNKTQNHIHTILRKSSPYNTTEKLRARLHKWRLPGFPRIHTERCRNNLNLVMSHLAPRIGLTCWRTIYRRWTTAGRMGNKGHHCLMGCADYDDSIVHYSRCRIIR